MTETLSHSFNGGVISPEFFGQVSDPKYKTGLGHCLNAICLPQGPVANRGGSRFVIPSASLLGTRMVPFAFSVDQTYAMELTNNLVRFHTDAGTLTHGGSAWDISRTYGLGDCVSHGGADYYCKQGHAASSSTEPGVGGSWTVKWTLMADGVFELVTTITTAELFDVHFVQSNDVMTLVHNDQPVAKITRFIPSEYTEYSFKFENETFGSTLGVPGSVVATTSVPGSGPTAWFVGPAYALDDIVSNNGAYYICILAHTPSLATEPPYLTNWLPWYLRTYAVTAVNETGVEESLPGYSGSCFNDLSVEGNINSISWDAVTGASGYNIYKDEGGIAGSDGNFSYIGSTRGGTSFIDNNKKPDISKSPPIENDIYGDTGDYPAETSYFQQRKVFGGTINQPEQVGMTRTGTEADLAFTIPMRDDDSIVFKAASREVSIIRHIIPLNDLIVLTSAAEWTISAAGGGALTPATVQLKAPSHIGASNMRPVAVNNNIVFEANRGSHWHELAYSFEAGGYSTRDLALRATHLFAGLHTVDMGYSVSPYPVIWSTRSDGRMIGMTYVPEEGVYAFHEHETKTLSGASKIKSLCVVPEGDYDYIYAAVERTINGATVVYIERFEPHAFETAEDAYFVDCGATLDNPKVVVGVSNADPGVVETSTVHDLATDDLVDFRDILTLQSQAASDNTHMASLNSNRYRVVVLTTTTFEIWTDEATSMKVDTSAWDAWAEAGGTIRQAVSVIESGLDHLIGETVSILANGAVDVDAVVDSNGDISLTSPASIVHVGLKIETEIQTLKPTLEINEAFGIGASKNVNRVWMIVYRSSGISAGPSLDKLTEYKQRTDEAYGQATRLVSGLLEDMPIEPSWDSDGSIWLKQYHPLPLNLQAIVLELVSGG